MTSGVARQPRHPTLWPWLVLGAFLIAVLLVRLLGAFATARSLPVLGKVPAFSLVDQTGAEFHSHELAGRVWIASFIYTTCPGPCPRVVQRVAEVQQRLGDEPDLRLVSISVDPDSDTPAVLEVYGKTRGIDPARWKLLTGDVEQVLELVRRGFLLAVAQAADTDAEIRAAEGAVVHSVHLVLVDRSMQLRGYYESTDAEAMERLVEDARRLLREAGA